MWVTPQILPSLEKNTKGEGRNFVGILNFNHIYTSLFCLLVEQDHLFLPLFREHLAQQDPHPWLRFLGSDTGKHIRLKISSLQQHRKEQYACIYFFSPPTIFLFYACRDILSLHSFQFLGTQQLTHGKLWKNLNTNINL